MVTSKMIRRIPPGRIGAPDCFWLTNEENWVSFGWEHPRKFGTDRPFAYRLCPTTCVPSTTFD